MEQEKQVTPEPEIENSLFDELKQKFSLEEIEPVIIELNGFKFFLKPINTKTSAWADSVALTHSSNFGEYQANLQVALGVAAVEKINDTVIDSREDRDKLFDFIFTQVDAELPKALFNHYNEKIDPLLKVRVKIPGSPEEVLKLYMCPKCHKAMSHAKRDETYFCHLDGSEMHEYNPTDTLPTKVEGKI